MLGDQRLYAGESIVLTKDTILEASWRDRVEYTVSYISGDEEILIGTAYEGLPYTVDMTIPTDKTKLFTGWSLDGDVLEGGDVITVEDDITLTANWRERETFTLTFVVDGSVIGSVLTVLEASSVTVDMVASSPWAEFLGWSDGHGLYLVGSQYVITADTVLHAVWGEKTPSCTEDPDDGEDPKEPETPGDDESPDEEDPGTDDDDNEPAGGDDDHSHTGTTGGSTEGSGSTGDRPSDRPSTRPETPSDDDSEGPSDEPSGDDPVQGDPDDGTDEVPDDGDDLQGPIDHGPDDDGGNVSDVTQTVSDDSGEGGIAIPVAVAAAVAAVVVCMLLVVARRS